MPRRKRVTKRKPAMISTEKPKLVLEFPTTKMRDCFLSQLSCGLEQEAMTRMEDGEGFSVTFDYKRAFRAWGWDGKGDPVVEVKER